MSSCWQVRDYRTARAVLAHSRLDRTAGLAFSENPLVPHILNQSGAVHHRLRASVAHAVEATLPRVALTARRCAAELIARCSGEGDVAGSFVRPFALVLVDELVGLSSGDPDELDWWHRAALTTDAGTTREVVAAIDARLRTKVADRRREPREDMLSQLVRDGVNDDELVATAYFAFSAGYVNLANFLGRALLALARHPDQYMWLRANRGAVPTAVDELLRYAEPPGRASLRFAAREVNVAGRPLPAGTAVHVFRAAANRDPGRFRNPERLDLRRADARTSLAFGAGPHYCVGAALVRATTDLCLLVVLDHVVSLHTTVRTDREWDFAAPLWLEIQTANRASRALNESFGPPERLTSVRTQSGGTQ